MDSQIYLRLLSNQFYESHSLIPARRIDNDNDGDNDENKNKPEENIKNLRTHFGLALKSK